MKFGDKVGVPQKKMLYWKKRKASAHKNKA